MILFFYQIGYWETIDQLDSFEPGLKRIKVILPKYDKPTFALDSDIVVSALPLECNEQHVETVQIVQMES